MLQIQIKTCRCSTTTKYVANAIVAPTLGQRSAMLRMIDGEDRAVVIAVSRKLGDIDTQIHLRVARFDHCGQIFEFIQCGSHAFCGAA